MRLFGNPKGQFVIAFTGKGVNRTLSAVLATPHFPKIGVHLEPLPVVLSGWHHYELSCFWEVTKKTPQTVNQQRVNQLFLEIPNHARFSTTSHIFWRIRSG